MDFYITTKEVADRICKIVNTAVDLEVKTISWCHAFGEGTLIRKDNQLKLEITLNTVRLTQDGTPPYEVASLITTSLQNRYDVVVCNYTFRQASFVFNKR